MAEEDDGVEITQVSCVGNPNQVWAIEKVNAAEKQRDFIQTTISEYKRKNPGWEKKALSVVAERIAKVVKATYPHLVMHVVKNIVWTVLSSSMSGSCEDPGKKA